MIVFIGMIKKYNGGNFCGSKNIEYLHSGSGLRKLYPGGRSTGIFSAYGVSTDQTIGAGVGQQAV